MAKGEDFDATRYWLCEECGEVHEDMKDPPDSCKWCGYKYFDCLADVQSARGTEA